MSMRSRGRASDAAGAPVDPRHQATIVPAVARGILELAQDRGVSPDRLCRGLGFSQETLTHEDTRLSHRQARSLIVRAQKALHDPMLGLALGQRESPVSWGLAGLAMFTCSTLGEAVGYGLEHQEVSGAMVQHMFIEDGLRCHVLAVPLIFDLEIEPFLVEQAFSGAVSVVRAMVGRDFCPVQVDFAHACTGSHRAYESFFRCPVRFEADEHRITLERKWLDVQLTGYDRITREMVRRQLNPLLRVPIGQDDLLASVASRIRHGLQDHTSQKALAEQVHVSERTLRRRLDALDTSYRDLRDATRYERARDLLINTTMSIAEVARNVGYSDARSFRRAFKRWSGLLPTDIRQLPPD